MKLAHNNTNKKLRQQTQMVYEQTDKLENFQHRNTTNYSHAARAQYQNNNNNSS